MWSCPRVLENCQKSAATSAILPSGAFLFSAHSQTSPLELITVTCHSQLSCDFPPESQKSSAYPSACLTPKRVCLALYFNPVTTAWPLVLSRDQLCCFSSQDFIPFALFPHPKINSYLSLLCSKYFKRVIHAEEEPKWRKLLKCRSSSKWRMKGKERGEKREQETCSEIFLLPPNFFSSGACINPVSATAGNKVTQKSEAYTVPRE